MIDLTRGSYLATGVQQAGVLDELESFYSTLELDFADAGRGPVTFPPGTAGARRKDLGPAIHAQVTQLLDHTRELVGAHADLLEQLREWRRLG